MGRDFRLAVVYPRRVFTSDDHKSSLRDLSLVPSSALLVLPPVSHTSIYKNLRKNQLSLCTHLPAYITLRSKNHYMALVSNMCFGVGAHLIGSMILKASGLRILGWAFFTHFLLVGFSFLPVWRYGTDIMELRL